MKRCLSFELLNHDGAISCVSVDGYFEDENYNAIDTVDFESIKSGEPNPVILGNVDSVMRLGPSSLQEDQSLSLDDSHIVFHFVQLMGVIQRGRWWKQGVSYSSGDGVSSPDLESTVSALAILRQFFLKRDQSFQRAVDTYLRVVGDPAKALWVGHEREQFDLSLDRIPFGPTTGGDDPLKDMTCIEVIDLFIYGTGLFHRESDKNLEDKLMDLRVRTNRELLLFKFHSACREVLQSPRRIAAVLHWEFANWIASGSCPPPNRIIVENLFKSSDAQRGW